jgi:hypothetical protein
MGKKNNHNSSNYSTRKQKHNTMFHGNADMAEVSNKTKNIKILLYLIN